MKIAHVDQEKNTSTAMASLANTTSGVGKSSQKEIAGITGLRGIAACWVMLFHISSKSQLHLLSKKEVFLGINWTFLFKGWMGVDIFFVLTGFLLFSPFADSLFNPTRPLSFKRYFKRRFFRILPAYYIQLTILALLAYEGLYNASSYKTWLAHIFLVNNFSVHWWQAINAVYWSLPIEFDFYFLLPLLFLTMRKYGFIKPAIAMVTINTLYLLVAYHFIQTYPVDYKVWLFTQLPAKLNLFLAGITLAYIYRKHGDFLTRGHSEALKTGITMIGIAMILICSDLFFKFEYLMWAGHLYLYIADIIAGIAIMILIASTIIGGRFNNLLFANPVIVYLGNISYGIYLWHTVIILLLYRNANISSFFSHYVGYQQFLILSLITVPLTLAVASLSYYLVEKPAFERSH